MGDSENLVSVLGLSWFALGRAPDLWGSTVPLLCHQASLGTMVWEVLDQLILLLAAGG